MNDWTNGEYTSRREVEQDLEAYATEYLLNDYNTADTMGVDFSSVGFELVNMERYKSVYHYGMNAYPKAILKELQEENPDNDYIFQVGEQSQFYIGFNILSRPNDYEG